MSEPDMCLPIAYALFWPERVEQDSGSLDWTRARQLTFEPPDNNRFPMLKLAYEAAEAGGTAPAVYNAANEVAVAAFLEQTVKFTEIVDIVRKTVDTVKTVVHPQLEDILEADRQARMVAGAIREKTAC